MTSESRGPSLLAEVYFLDHVAILTGAVASVGEGRGARQSGSSAWEGRHQASELRSICNRKNGPGPDVELRFASVVAIVHLYCYRYDTVKGR